MFCDHRSCLDLRLGLCSHVQVRNLRLERHKATGTCLILAFLQAGASISMLAAPEAISPVCTFATSLGVESVSALSSGTH